MAMWLRQSTATQRILLGIFVDSTDGNTEKTGLSIANTDIKLWKEGAIAEASKNSGGATHLGNGRYYTVLDAGDTDTPGKLEISVHVTGALAVRREYMVLPANVYDALVLGSDYLDVSAIQLAGQAITAAAGVTFPSSVASPTNITAGTITTVGTTINLTNLPAITAGWITANGITANALNGKGDWNVGKTGYSLTQAFPSNFASMSITAGGLVDITQAAADKAWGTATRILTAGTNIALAKGIGVTGFNDLDAPGMANAVWNEVIPSTYGAGTAGKIVGGNVDATISSRASQASVDAAAGYIDTEVAAIKAKTDFLPSAIAGEQGGVFIAGSNAPTAVNITGNITGNVSGSVGSVSGTVGSVSGSVGSVTAGVTVTTNNDKTGYGLSSATVQAIWAALTSQMTTVGSIGKKLGDWVVGTIDTYIGNTKQTGDAYARLGAPAGESHAADVAAVKAETTTIQVNTGDIQTRLPAALVDGRLDSNVSAIGNSTSALAAFKQAVKGNVVGTVGVGSTTTSIITSSLTPAGSVADQFKGRLITFSDDTTTPALRGQSTDIIANTVSATPILTVTPLTTPAVTGDTFSIT